MSKFYGKSSSESSSSDSEVETKQPVRKSAFNKLAAFSSDESSSDESVARSKPMKKDIFVEILRKVRSHIKNNDFPGLGSDYSDAIKAFEKIEGSGELPKAFIRVLYELNSFISELQASGATKKMSQVKAQSVNKLKAQMNKGNKPFEVELGKCADNPTEYDVLNEGGDAEAHDSGNESDSEDVSEADSSAESDDLSSNSSESSDDSSESSSDSSSSSSDDSSSSESESSTSSWDESEDSSSDEEEDEMAKRERRMRRWLKDSDESDYESGKKPQQTVEVRRPARKAKVVVVGGDAKQEEDNDEQPVMVEKKGPVISELGEKELMEKFRELISGKTPRSSSSPREVLAQLDECIVAASQWGTVCELTFAVSTVSFVLDANVSGLAKNGSLPDDLWLGAIARVRRIMETLEKNKGSYPVSIHELVVEMKPETDETALKRRRMAGNGMVSLTAELIDEEFVKSFQSIDLSESPSVYAAKLGLVSDLIALLIEVRAFLLSENQGSQGARISSRILFHLGYQTMKSEAVLSRKISHDLPNFSNQLADTVLSFGSKKDKAGAILLLAFIAASRGEVVKAKRLISADLFDLVAVSEVSLQIQYNRALAMVGIASFFSGDVKDCFNLLTDMCSTGRLRELLAQGVNRQQQQVTAAGGSQNIEKSVAEAERRRLLPFFMHMNVELIEAAYSLSALILEVPHLAKSLLPGPSNNTRRLAKYRRQIESYERQMYSGPPENAKDAIALAGKAILNDDVEKAVELIDSMRIWDGSAAGGSEGVKKNTLMLVRQAALQTYLINNSASHKSFSLSALSALFGLSLSTVTANICRCVMSGDLSGKIAASSDLFIPSVQASSKIHSLTQSLAEQVTKLELVHSDPKHEIVVSILAQLNPPPPLPGQPEREVGSRRIRRAGLASAKALAASQLAAEKRLQAGLAKRRGWDNARGQPLQGQVISTERKKVFGNSYGY